MSGLIIIKDVRGYVDKDGTVMLHIEDVARGLGITQEKNGSMYIRWETVDRYLCDLGFSQLAGKGQFIPENIFYRLCMKASNKLALDFQTKVCDEILPAIRKHGAYIAPDTLEQMIASPEFGIRLLTALKDEQGKRIVAEQKVLELAPKADFYDTVTGSRTAIPFDHAAKVLGYRGVGRNKLFDFLRQRKVLQYDNQPYQQFIDRGYFRVIESKFTKPNGDIGISFKTLIFQRGLDYVRKLLDEAGYRKIEAVNQ